MPRKKSATAKAATRKKPARPSRAPKKKAKTTTRAATPPARDSPSTPDGSVSPDIVRLVPPRAVGKATAWYRGELYFGRDVNHANILRAILGKWDTPLEDLINTRFYPRDANDKPVENPFHWGRELMQELREYVRVCEDKEQVNGFLADLARESKGRRVTRNGHAGLTPQRVRDARARAEAA